MAEKKTESSIEEALERIEVLVQEMEEGQLPLEDIITRFEEGSELVKACQKKLELAEERIKIILRNAAGPSGLADFEESRE
ncbi:MAG: exodeoxyribonuclease VII small subunit [Terrimicrobiaceae bacterium]